MYPFPYRVALLLAFPLLGVLFRLVPVQSPPSLSDGLQTDPPAEESGRSPQSERHRTELRIPNDSTLQEVLIEAGLSVGSVHPLVQQVKPIYDLNRIRSGRLLELSRLSDGSLDTLQYSISDEEYLLVRRQGGRYLASRQKYQYDVIEQRLYGEIEQSLWNTLLALGETPQLVQTLHEILQWDIDFTAIQPRDSFRLIVEKHYLAGDFVRYGDIRAVQFSSGERDFSAFLFKPEGTAGGYFDPQGRSVRKAFLKVPFNFDPRITSRFSHSRYHPILKKRRPHLGVDYGAPTGTPVLASAAGTVVLAGRDGGYGKTVRIRHPNGYTTGYAHLSRIEVRKGQKVAQGDQIGRVGSTGLSTGPHLDYRVQDKRGRFINPTKVSLLPSEEAVAKAHLERFSRIRDALSGELASIPLATSVLCRGLGHYDIEGFEAGSELNQSVTTQLPVHLYLNRGIGLHCHLVDLAVDDIRVPHMSAPNHPHQVGKVSESAGGRKKTYI